MRSGLATRSVQAKGLGRDKGSYQMCEFANKGGLRC